MSENTNERLDRYAEAIQLANNTETRTAAAHRVMAVADAEQAELRAEAEHWKDTTRLAMSALTTSRDVLHEASGLPEGIDDADVVDETVLALRTRTVKAEAERDRARSLAATLEARLAQVEALDGEPYILADVLCHLYHDFDPTALTGFATDKGFVVSCALCKARAREVLAVIRAALKGDA